MSATWILLVLENVCKLFMNMALRMIEGDAPGGDLGRGILGSVRHRPSVVIAVNQ